MKHWQTKSLAELCDVQIGRTPRRDNPRFWGGDAVWVTVGELNEGEIKSSKERVSDFALRECMPRPVPAGSLLFSFKLSIGKMAVAGCPLYTNEAIAALPIRNPSQLCRDFLQYALLAHSHEGLANTAVLGKVLNKDKVQKIVIPVPPLSEQKRLVRLLNEAKRLRKLRAQADRRTDDLMPALFHEMFGKRSWSMEKLDSLCNRITVGYVGPMAMEYVASGIPFLRGQNVKRGSLKLADILFISDRFHSRIEKSAIRPSDVVSVRTGKPGTTAVVPPSLDVANCADLIVMTCGARLDPYFLCEFLNQRLGDQDKIAGATGIAQQHFNIGEARRLKVPVPPMELQNAFAARTAEIRAVQAEQAASRQRIDDLFKSMLHRAFQGNL